MPLHCLMSSTSHVFAEVSEFEAALVNDSVPASSFYNFFDSGDIRLVRVPARLDIMGGVADCSGSNVCEGTLRCGIALGIQNRSDQFIQLRRLGINHNDAAHDVSFHLEQLLNNGTLIELQDLKKIIAQIQPTAWSVYVLGCIYILLQEKILNNLQSGMNIGINSGFPLGAGIGASAALVVATLQAFNLQFGLNLPAEKIASLGQEVEKQIFNSPCGYKDLLTISLGQHNKLMHILCQPGEIRENIVVPEDYEFVGINSMLEAESDEAYNLWRMSSMMGQQIISRDLRNQNLLDKKQLLTNLCDLTPEDFENTYRNNLPEKISGSDFIKEYGKPEAEGLLVDPETIYPVRAATAHPIFENDRVIKFIELLKKAKDDTTDASMKQVGRLMLASHESYARNCNLSNEKIDFLVETIKEVGRKHHLFGAKITSRGAGGTVAFVGKKRHIGDALEEIVLKYREATGLTPQIFRGSSPGADEYGNRIYRFEK